MAIIAKTLKNGTLNIPKVADGESQTISFDWSVGFWQRLLFLFGRPARMEVRYVQGAPTRFRGAIGSDAFKVEQYGRILEPSADPYRPQYRETRLDTEST